MRVITIQVIITDKEKASWIWDNHMGKDTDNGVFVQVIHEGSLEDIIASEQEDDSPA